MRKKSSRKNNKDLSRRQVPEQCVRCGRKPPTHFMSALQRMKSVTIVRNKDTTPESANIKEKPDQMRGKPIKNQLHQCTCEGQEFEETMYYAEQIATVEEVRHIKSKAKLHSIKVKGHDPSNAERHGFFSDHYLNNNLAENSLYNLEH